jgi:hypothetical protein
MLPSQCQKYFSDEQGLVELLKLCEEKFAVIDDYSEQLMNHIMTTIGEFSIAKEQFAGIKEFLNPIYGESVTWRKNKGLKHYMQLKTEWENTPATKDDKGKLVKEKFLDGATEKEADEAISSYRRVRNLLQYYIESCSDIIKECEQRIYELKGEAKVS